MNCLAIFQSRAAWKVRVDKERQVKKEEDEKKAKILLEKVRNK